MNWINPVAFALGFCHSGCAHGLEVGAGLGLSGIFVYCVELGGYLDKSSGMMSVLKQSVTPPTSPPKKA